MPRPFEELICWSRFDSPVASPLQPSLSPGAALGAQKSPDRLLWLGMNAGRG
jgi:hypothetical protein